MGWGLAEGRLITRPSREVQSNEQACGVPNNPSGRYSVRTEVDESNQPDGLDGEPVSLEHQIDIGEVSDAYPALTDGEDRDLERGGFELDPGGRPSHHAICEHLPATPGQSRELNGVELIRTRSSQIDATASSMPRVRHPSSVPASCSSVPKKDSSGMQAW